jgi:hypothetical protein
MITRERQPIKGSIEVVSVVWVEEGMLPYRAERCFWQAGAFSEFIDVLDRWRIAFHDGYVA